MNIWVNPLFQLLVNKFLKKKLLKLYFLHKFSQMNIYSANLKFNLTTPKVLSLIFPYSKIAGIKVLKKG